MTILAVDFGATKVEAALFTPTGELIDGTRHRAPTGPERDAEALFESVRTVVASAVEGREGEIAGIGLGSCGPIDRHRGTISPLNLPAWKDFPLRDRISGLVPGVPVEMHIDGVCIALAEHWKGAGQGAGHLMGMIVSTGIGGGIVIDGRPVDGATGNAGHVGHLEVAGYDDPCACGGSGCVEAVASGTATVRWARENGWRAWQDPADLGGLELVADAQAGDPVALAAFERAGTALGRALASATSLLELDRIVIGGGFAESGELLLGPARRAFVSRTRMPFIAKCEIVPTGLSGEGPLMGAAALVARTL